jgi:predicted ATPase
MLFVLLGTSVGLNQCQEIDSLVGYLRARTFLLILDNCEHLLDPVAHVVNAIISGCPSARILATSHQALAVEGERVYRVPPLDLPEIDTLSADAALQFDAIRLFRDRAEAADSRFELTDEIVPPVSEICRRVDGIALAIELAAARINAFPPAILAQQIGQHFILLSGGIRTALPRHKTMRALFDWSYDLLDDRERELFRRLSIFVSGFTLELVRALYEDDDARNVPILLASLVDKSFVHCDILVGPRYRLLEPARQYGREKLLEQNEFERASRAHALALIALAEEFDSRLEVVPDHVWGDRIERERENFRAVFEWALRDSGDVSLGRRLAASRSGTWSGFATGEVRTWLDAARTERSDSTPPRIRAKLELNAARAAVIFGPSWHADDGPEARIDACRHALAMQDRDDQRAIATGQYWLGVALRDSGRFDDADPTLREARTTARSVGAQTEYNAATTALAVVRYGAGDFVEARALIMESLKQSEDAGSDRVAADARAALAEIEFASGHVEEALRLNEKTMEYFRSHANLIGVPLTLVNSSGYLFVLGRYQEAREYAAESLRLSQGLGISHPAVWAMQRLVAIAVHDAASNDEATNLAHAAEVLGFVDETASRKGMPRYIPEQHEYEQILRALRNAFAGDELAAIMATGKAWSEEQAIAEALAL